MPRASKDIVVGIVSGLITVAIIRAAGEFAVQVAMGNLERFVIAFLPIWVGAAVGLIVWMVLSVYRVTHGRDDEFKAWLRDQERNISENFTNQFRKMAAETETIRSANTAAMEGFHEAFEPRLSAVENRHRSREKNPNP